MKLSALGTKQTRIGQQQLWFMQGKRPHATLPLLAITCVVYAHLNVPRSAVLVWYVVFVVIILNILFELKVIFIILH